jgi:hypothetical protein
MEKIPNMEKRLFCGCDYGLVVPCGKGIFHLKG